MSCRDVQRCVHAFIDAELDPKQIVEIESHVAQCEECRRLVEFERWFKSELGQSIGKLAAPSGLRTMVARSLDRAERKSRLRTLLPRAGMAAAIAAGVIAALLLPEWLTPSMLDLDTPQVQLMPRPVIDYVAERHSRPLPVEVTGPDSGAVSMWFRDKVDFAVRPPSFPASQVQLVGGRISHVGDQQAAHLLYDHNGRPITVIVFADGAGIPFGGVQRQAGNHTVHVGQSRGFNVAVWRQGGVSYAATSDLDQSDMIRLVSSVQ